MSKSRIGYAVIAAAVAVTALPAGAYAAGPDLTFSIRNGSAGEDGKAFPLRLNAADPEAGYALKNVKVTIDTSAAADLLTATAATNPYADPSCSTAGTITTCDLDTLASHTEFGEATMVVKATKGAEPGSSGKLTVTLAADGIQPLVATTTITVAQQVDLAAGIAATVPEAKPGESVTPGLQITNLSDKPVDGAGIRLAVYDGLKRTGDFENCYHLSDEVEYFCRFDATLEPGATYVLDGKPTAVRATAKPGKETYSVMIWTGDDFDATGYTNGYQHGTGAPLKLVKQTAARSKAQRVPSVEADTNLGNNLAFGQITVLAGAGTPPSTSPSASPSASRSASPSSPGAGGGTGGGDSDGGGLPVTGTPVGLIAGAGAGILLVGVLGFVVTRRRRARFVA
jgi:LPXTG-motif cell wall-anchored protein